MSQEHVRIKVFRPHDKRYGHCQSLLQSAHEREALAQLPCNRRLAWSAVEFPCRAQQREEPVVHQVVAPVDPPAAGTSILANRSIAH